MQHEARDEPSLTFSSATVSRMGVRTVQLPSMGVFKVVFKVFAPLALAVVRYHHTLQGGQ